MGGREKFPFDTAEGTKTQPQAHQIGKKNHKWK